MQAPPSEPQHWYQLPHAPAPGTVLATFADLVDGQARMVNVAATTATSDPKAIFKLLLLRSGETVQAFANRCPHFGVPLAAQQSQLIHTPHVSLTCNVHYSHFRWTDGMCTDGECVGEALLAIPTVVDAHGHVLIAPSSAAGVANADA
jgi:nitrite reductase/ring-hydroxylating ferredoxin subunit